MFCIFRHYQLKIIFIFFKLNYLAFTVDAVNQRFTAKRVTRIEDSRVLYFIQKIIIIQTRDVFKTCWLKENMRFYIRVSYQGRFDSYIKSFEILIISVIFTYQTSIIIFITVLESESTENYIIATVCHQLLMIWQCHL